MLDSRVTFAGAWVPQGTHIAQIVAVARVHIWAPGQVLGIRAQLQGIGLCSRLAPSPPYGLVGGQKHTCDQRDADTFPSGRTELHLSAEWRAWVYYPCILMQQREPHRHKERLHCAPLY